MTAPVLSELDPISGVSLALAARVAPHFPPRLWGVPSVIGLPMTAVEFQRLADTTPRLHIGFESFKAKNSGARAFAGDMAFRLIAVVKNTGSREAVQLGDKHGPGLYPAAVALVALLHGWTIGDIGSVEVTSVNQATIDGWRPIGAGAVIIDFTVHTKLGDVLGEVAAAQPFLRLLSEFEVNAEPDAPEPAPEPPAAAPDTIELPGASS